MAVEDRAGGPELGQGAGEEGLSSEARIDGHDEDEVQPAEGPVEPVEGGRGTQDEARPAAEVADEGERAIEVIGPLGVDGDPRRARVREVPDQAVHRTGHEVHVDGGLPGRAGREGAAHHRPHGEVGDEVVVHHVEVDEVGAGPDDRLHLLSKAREVRGEEGRRDPRRARGVAGVGGRTRRIRGPSGHGVARRGRRHPARGRAVILAATRRARRRESRARSTESRREEESIEIAGG